MMMSLEERTLRFEVLWLTEKLKTSKNRCSLLRLICERMKKLDIEAEILSGKGYMYFSGPATDRWHTTIVPGIPNVKNLTDEQGFKLFQEMCELNCFQF